MLATRDRCWLTHRRREPWTVCPQCGAPLQWRRTDVDGWVPCDVMPVLYVAGGSLRLVKRRDMLGGCSIYRAGQHCTQKPQYAYMPHYYTCPVLRQERAAWAKAQNTSRGW